MKIAANPHRGQGLTDPALADIPYPSTAAHRPADLLARCPRAQKTDLIAAPDLANRLGVAEVNLKDERNRMGLGSFKALGAAYVIARKVSENPNARETYVTASAGNHGLSVAAGAAAFQQKAVIYISEQVPQPFADRITALGAEDVRSGETYEASMAEAAQAAARDGAILLSDSSWQGYVARPHILMEGYLVLMEEVFADLTAPPSHIFLQAGVGGLAGASAAAARAHWGGGPTIIVVEPEAAPALAASIKAGRAVETHGPVSAMGRLDCKEPSLIALKGLARDADFFVTLTEEEGERGADIAQEAGFASTPSGAAGLAALVAASAAPDQLGLSSASRVLAILSEGPAV